VREQGLRLWYEVIYRKLDRMCRRLVAVTGAGKALRSGNEIR